MFRNEDRRQPQGLADLLMPFALVEDGVLLQQDGSLLAGWSYRGPDLNSAVAEELEALSARLNSAILFGSGWMVQCDAIRSPAPGYPGVGAFPDPVTRMIDEERRQQFTRVTANYETEYFFSLTYLPPPQLEEKAKGWLFEGRKAPGPATQVLERFKQRVESFENIFGQLFRIERLCKREVKDEYESIWTYDTLLQYFQRCVTGTDHPFALPDIPVYLHDVLGCEDFVGGTEPRIGKKHIGIVAIDGFPKASYPGMLAALDTLSIEYRWNTRAILIDPEVARKMLEKISKKWKSKTTGMLSQILKFEGTPNHYAAEQEADAQAAMAVADTGDVQFLHYSSNVVCLDTDPAQLHEKMRDVARVIQNLGFHCRVEDLNAVEAWRGSLPGDGYSNVRRVIMHSLNVEDILPVTSVWAGLKYNPSGLMPKHTPPLLYAATSGQTPFRWHPHVGDLGHAVCVGPSGMGKSTFLGLTVAQWFRYPNAQVFAFDKGYSLWMLAQAAGGDFYDLHGDAGGLGFCPLQEIDSESDQSWAVDWLEVLCNLSGLTLGPHHRNELTAAVAQLRLSPTRTMTELYANVMDVEVRDALKHYVLGGAMGHILDCERDSLRHVSQRGKVRLTIFETEQLLQKNAQGIIPVLLYLFRCIERMLDGSPTLIPLDEAWAYLQHPLFKDRLKDWLKTLRKKNAAVILATQQISDLTSSGIEDVIFESCPTKVLPPNTECRNPTSRSFYERAGLNGRELDQLAMAIPKKHYYMVSPLGRRMVDLGIGPVALAFVGVNGKEERMAAQAVMDEYPDTWRSEWLKVKGQHDWAEYYEREEHKCGLSLVG